MSFAGAAASLSLTFVCAPCASAQQPVVDLDVLSANGRYLAEVRRVHAGPGGAPSAQDRGELTVYELRTGEERRRQWSGLHACDGIDVAHWLTDDGSTFVHLGARAHAGEPLVLVIHKGQRRAALDAAVLGIDAAWAPDGRWIEPAADTARMRSRSDERDGFVLDLLGGDGRVRSIDLAHGELALSPAREDREVRVEPAVPEDGPRGELVYINSWSVPALVTSSDAVAVEVQGSFPTPNWKLAGFEIVRDDANDLWTLQPRALPGSGVSAQVLRPFSAIARIVGLPPGKHRLRVEDRTGPVEAVSGQASSFTRDVRVVAADLVVSLSTSGGIAYIERTIALYTDGRLEEPRRFEEPRWRTGEPRVALAPLESWRTIERRVAELPDLHSYKQSHGGPAPESLEYELVWNGPRGLAHVIRHDPTLDEPMLGLVQALERLTSRAETPPPPRYVIDPSASTLTVATKSAGLLSALGHDHTIAAKGFSGSVELEREHLDGARLELTVRADSLAVVDRESQEDARAIEQEMRKNVLETARYPEIVFRSTKAAVEPLGERTWKARLTGDLTLHGKTRSVTIPAHFSLEENQLRAIGDLTLRQTDWNIRPTSIAGGTVKVADEVVLSFDLVARR